MLYKIAHILRDRMPFLWTMIGWVNSILFGLRYGRYSKGIDEILKKYSEGSVAKGRRLRFKRLDTANIPALAAMFAEQPEEAFDYFRPHDFDTKTLRHLSADKSFLAFVVIADAEAVGYFFQRSFFWGKSFRGYMTDYRWQRQGINRLMNLCATDISSLLGLRVFGSISPENIASMKSAQSANDVVILETLDNGDYYVQYLPKRKDS